MFRPSPFASRLSLFALPLLVTACAASNAPQLIGAAPKVTSVPPPPGTIIRYDSIFTLEVWDVSAAADRAAQIAYDYGGYVSDSQMWKAGNEVYATVTLAVPVAQFDSAREAVLRLGTLVNETLTGDPLPGGYGAEWYNYSTLTVNLRPINTARVWPAPPGWNPADTAGRAFGVFVLIFRWLVDAVIWVAVVAGPFVLMGLGLRSLLRRAKPKA